MPVYETPTDPSEVSPLLPSLKQPSYASASTVSLSSESSSSSRDSHSDQPGSDDVEATGEGEETQGAKQADSQKHVIRMISVLLIGMSNARTRHNYCTVKGATPPTQGRY